MPAETTIVSELAERYATALFDLAKEQGLLDQIGGDLDDLTRLVGEVEDLRNLVRSPLLSLDDQSKGMDAVLAKAGAQPLTRNFVGTLTRNRRLYALTDCARGYKAKLAAHRGSATANVRTARPLSEAQLSALRAEITRVVGRDVSIDVDVDASLLGGLIVQVGSKMVDGSLKTKLQTLAQSMKGVG